MERYLEFAFNHSLLSLALVVVTYLLIQDFIESAFKRYQPISPLLAVTKMNDEATVVVDVSETNEFSTSHINGAINAPLSKLDDHLGKLSAHKKDPILIACQTGARAASAANKLGKAGFEKLFVITGGMQAWETDYKLPIKTSKKKPKT